MIAITFFGDFSLTENGITLSEGDSRAERLYRALAYLVKNRRRKVEVAEFSRFLHNGKPYSRYQGDSLVKTTLHRLRELLSRFGYEKTLLLENGKIFFDQGVAFTSDADRFDEIAERFVAANDDERLSLFDEATSLYRSRYLASFSGEGFTMPEAERYHRAFLAICDEALGLLVQRGEYRAAYERARRLVTLDPYAECLHYHEIYALLLSGDRALAELLYRNVSLLYQREFHVAPSARFHALKELLKPKETFDADTLDDALALLDASRRQEKSLARGALTYPVDLIRLLPLLKEGYLLFLKGDLDKILPELDVVFDQSTLTTRLSETALLLVTTLGAQAFEKKLAALRAIVREGFITLSVDYRKIP